MKKILILFLVVASITCQAQQKIEAYNLPVKTSNIAGTDAFVLNDFSTNPATVKQMAYSTLAKSIHDTASAIRSFIGGYYGSSNTNTGFGLLSGNLSATQGAFNSSYGYYSGYTLTTGTYNSLIGANAGRRITSGHDNAFMGYNAGGYVTTGTQNTIFGSNAGLGLSTGTNNIFIGYQAGQSATGNANVFIGKDAGHDNVSGTGNIFIGYQAGYNDAGSNHLFIANSYTSTPLIWGDYAASRLKINGSLTVDSLILAVKGIKYPDGTYANTASSGTSLAGSTNFNNTFYGDSAGLYSSSAIGNTLIGTYAGRYNMGPFGASNTAVGYKAMFNNTAGTQNVYIGREAGYTGTVNSSQNVFLGYQSGYFNTDGQYNLFCGFQSGFNNTTGYGNAFLGLKAGYANITGYHNVFQGDSSGLINSSGKGNVYIGYLTGGSSTTNNYNVYVGNSSGANNTGSYNTFIGSNAGPVGQSGNYNICIGANAGYSETGSNKLIIANSSTPNPLIYGDFSTNQVTIPGGLHIDSLNFTDGTVQKTAFMRAEKTLSPSNIMSSDTVTIIPAPGTGKYISIIKILMNVHYYGDKYETTSGLIELIFDDVNPFMIQYSTILSTTTDLINYYFTGTFNPIQISCGINKRLRARVSPTNITGTSTLQFIVYYTIETW